MLSHIHALSGHNIEHKIYSNYQEKCKKINSRYQVSRYRSREISDIAFPYTHSITILNTRYIQIIKEIIKYQVLNKDIKISRDMKREIFWSSELRIYLTDYKVKVGTSMVASLTFGGIVNIFRELENSISLQRWVPINQIEGV